MAKREPRVELGIYRIYRTGSPEGEWFRYRLVAVNLNLHFLPGRRRYYKTWELAHAAGRKVVERLRNAEFVG